MTQQPVQYSYTPPPQELPFYDALFQQADKSQSGYLSGQTAVEFLSSSKLPMDLLKTIWGMADQPPSNTLDKPKFYVAIRLIQLFQNGKRPNDAQLHLGEGVAVRPPYFEGINLQQIQQQQVAQPPQMQQPPHPQPSPTMQPQQVASPQLSPMQPAMQPQPVMQPQPTHLQPPYLQQQPQQQNQLVAQDPYSMTPTEQSRYESLFESYASQDGYVYGAQAVELFSKSGMERDALREVWNLSDGDPVDNRLDKVEFAIAMHLIVCVTKKGLPMPSGGTLPGTLARVRREAREGAAGTGQGGQNLQQLGTGQQPMGQQPHMQQQQGMVAPSSPGGIPSPDKMSGMSMPQMNGMQPQMGLQGMQHQMSQQPQQQGGLQSRVGQPQQMQLQQQQPGGFGLGGGAIGGESIEDAFAGLSAEPVNEDEYSIAPSIGGGGMNVGGSGTGYGTGGSVIPNQMSAGVTSSSQQHQYQHPPPRQHQHYATPASPKSAPAPAYYEPASPDSSASPPAPAPSLSPRPTAPRPPAPRPPAPRQQNHEHQYQHHQQHPPKSPTHTKQTHINHDSDKSSHELERLRSAHQKLQAEVISLRAKASLVSEEERDAQSEISKVAAQIAELSTELSGLKGQVAEAKVKLAEAVVTLKAMKEEKETLEESVKETRETHKALTSATEAVIEASETTMHLKARLLAEHARATESASQPVETADLFSWDAPAPAPASHSGQKHQSMGPSHWDAPAQVAAPVQSLRIDTNDADDDVSKFGDNQSVYTQSQNTSQVPNGMPNQTPFGGGYQSNDVNNAFFPMGGAPAPAPAETPMGGSSLYDTDFMGGGMTPMGGSQPAPTPSAADTNQDRSYRVSSGAQQLPPPVNSPTAKEVEALKKEALKAEKSFRTSEDLVRTLSREVESLESAARRAEEEAKKHETTSQKKKGSFVSGKKKAKKEYEKAAEIAAAERKKADDARQQLVAAQNETAAARKEAEQLRQQYEQAEIEAATAASYMSVQAENAKLHGQQPPVPGSNQYNDPFGGISIGGNNTNSSNPYGMGLMGGNPHDQGDYANPFL
ncbi:hypothetical protein ACHAXS_014351 [Conticribra weissflogii]